MLGNTRNLHWDTAGGDVTVWDKYNPTPASLRSKASVQLSLYLPSLLNSMEICSTGNEHVAQLLKKGRKYNLSHGQGQVISLVPRKASTVSPEQSKSSGGAAAAKLFRVACRNKYWAELRFQDLSPKTLWKHLESHTLSDPGAAAWTGSTCQPCPCRQHNSSMEQQVQRQDFHTLCGNASS